MTTLLRSRLAATSVCCGFVVLLTSAGNTQAQDSPGYRTRTPASSSPGARAGSSVRPPRLTGDQPKTRSSGRFRQQSFSPYQYLGPYPIGYYGSAYADDSVAGYSADSTPVREVDPANYSTEVKPARNVQTLDDSAAVGKLQVTEETDGSRKTVRLTWSDNGAGATQVAFFLADSAHAVLAAQTVRTPPFIWRFEPEPRTAFAGMTVVLPGGSLVTRYVRYVRYGGKDGKDGKVGRGDEKRLSP
jgi:hypothetical protein